LAVIVPLLIVGYISIANAQSLVPGIHGMSVVDGVKFTWVIISSDTDISINLRYLGQGTSPPVTVVATALTNPSVTSGTPSTMAGSQTLSAGWVSPTSITIRLEGGSTLYDADLITVVASPYGSAILPNASSTTNNEISPPPTTRSVHHQQRMNLLYLLLPVVGHSQIVNHQHHHHQLFLLMNQQVPQKVNQVRIIKK